MIEKCEKHFKTGKIAYTVFAAFIVLLSVAVPILIIVIGARLKISVIAELVLVDIGAVIACCCYKKSAYYVELENDKVKLYTDDGIVEKDVSDCKRIIKTASEFFMFFNDGIIRLCNFRKCREATACIKKENFPNVK